MKVLIINPADYLGKNQTNGLPYNPVKDALDRWVITEEEVKNTPDLTNVDLIEYLKPQEEEDI